MMLADDARGLSSGSAPNASVFPIIRLPSREDSLVNLAKDTSRMTDSLLRSERYVTWLFPRVTI